MDAAAFVELQCGHGRLTVENAADRPADAGTQIASMRPRSVDRGERGGPATGRDDAASASMRPRSVDRGEHRSRPGRKARVIPLQCGHGRLTVENAAARRRATSPAWSLQCGHGRLTVENSTSRGRAATARPALQCGHGRLTVENAAGSRRQSVQAGKLQCGHGRLTVENTIPAAMFTRGLRKLQCGHGRLTVENLVNRRGFRLPLWLQCGHGRLTVENSRTAVASFPPLKGFNAATVG